MATKPSARSPNTKTAWLPPGAHKTRRVRAGVCYIRITAWRGKGAPTIGAYRAPTIGEAERAARADAAEIARRYADARAGFTPTTTLAGLMLRWQASAEYKSVSASTQAKRDLLLKDMKASIGKMATLALAARRARAVIVKWRDEEAARRGPAAGDDRLAILHTLLEWARRQGEIALNPAAGIAKLHYADRSDLIWEDDALLIPYLETCAAERAALPARADLAPHQRAAMAARIAAAERAVTIACWTGMRRGDLVRAGPAWRQGAALVYVAQKGARRRRTAKRRAKLTMVPIQPALAAVLDATPAGQETYIVNAHGKAYTPAALGALVADMVAQTLTRLAAAEGLSAADVAPRARHLHDCKGTFVTRMALIRTPAGARAFTNAEIAAMVDWSEDNVEAILARYLSADAVAKNFLARLNPPAEAAS